MADKILVVDDDPRIQRLFEYTLKREGYQVITASNGIDGLRKAQEESPDLLILDVMLPGLDGFEVCHRLRGAPTTSNIPVVMVSAKGRPNDMDIAKKVGADKYLVKPIERIDLINTVQELLAGTKVKHKTQARVIAFIGSRGGAGTSTVVACISAILAQMGHRIILVDLCSSFGNLPSLMGLKPQHTLGDLFSRPRNYFSSDDLEAVLSLHSSGVRLLSAEQTSEEHSKITSAGIDMLLQELAAMADFVLIDMPTIPSEIINAALRKCDFTNLVTNTGPETSSRTSAALSLLTDMGIDSSAIGIVIVDRSGTRPDEELPQLSSLSGFPLMGKIPYDSMVSGGAEAHGIALALNAPSSPVALALNKLAEKLL